MNKHQLPLEELSRRERQMLEAVYKLGQATAAQVLAELDDPPGYSAVRKWLSILEGKGLLVHEKKGRTYVYRPAISRKSASKRALRSLVDVFFGGSSARAASALLQDSDKLSPAERKQIQALLDSTKDKA